MGSIFPSHKACSQQSYFQYFHSMKGKSLPGSPFTLLKETAIAFSDDNALKLSSSLSYYTIFSIGPLLLVIISLSGMFLKKETVEGRLYEEMDALLGPE